MKSTHIKSKIYNNFCNAKDKKKSYYIKNSKLGIQIQEFKPNKKKQRYYKLYFQENRNNLVKVWNEMKEIILIKKNEVKHNESV